jgi:hypothetical protein
MKNTGTISKRNNNVVKDLCNFYGFSAKATLIYYLGKFLFDIIPIMKTYILYFERL